ncbi:hypothetical protein BDV28DRAFT_74936 [Aspergillus coremiiformis]|uniref:Uncharacterized protein n=1 Tax=Aspergillus coremiiformis TaxID=138285 RepID=A0A5N6YTN7_9EURO|nr:hypothetical protein BDV28DRAFT_74936 [Aspergillus coremiiformis]
MSSRPQSLFTNLRDLSPRIGSSSDVTDMYPPMILLAVYIHTYLSYTVYTTWDKEMEGEKRFAPTSADVLLASYESTVGLQNQTGGHKERRRFLHRSWL